jgi:hypothetical protein
MESSAETCKLSYQAPFEQQFEWMAEHSPVATMVVIGAHHTCDHDHAHATCSESGDH